MTTRLGKTESNIAPGHFASISSPLLCEVTVPGKAPTTLRTSLLVTIDGQHGGRTTQPIIISNRGIVERNAIDAVVRVRDTGGYKFTQYNGAGFVRTEPQIEISVGQNSQFYRKALEHERVHVGQFKGTAQPDLHLWWSKERAVAYVNQKLKDHPYPFENARPERQRSICSWPRREAHSRVEWRTWRAHHRHPLLGLDLGY